MSIDDENSIPAKHAQDDGFGDYEVGADPDDDMAVMYEACEADLIEMRAYATRLEAALVRAHACPTVREDGDCDGCFVSDVLATRPGRGPLPEPTEDR